MSLDDDINVTLEMIGEKLWYEKGKNAMPKDNFISFYKHKVKGILFGRYGDMEKIYAEVQKLARSMC